MKRISKRRLAQLRRNATSDTCGSPPTPDEVVCLLDAYERKPDEVAVGWVDYHDDAFDMSVYPKKVDTNDRHVRVEVFYLTKGGSRG